VVLEKKSFKERFYGQIGSDHYSSGELNSLTRFKILRTNLLLVKCLAVVLLLYVDNHDSHIGLQKGMQCKSFTKAAILTISITCRISQNVTYLEVALLGIKPETPCFLIQCSTEQAIENSINTSYNIVGAHIYPAP